MALTRFARASVVRGFGMPSVQVCTLKSWTIVALLTLTACGGGGGDGGDDVDNTPGSSPRLTITQPLDGSLALPSIPIDVRCVDDRPGCQVDVRYYDEYCTGRGCTVDVRDYSEVLARGTAGLATTLDLA